MVVWKDESIMSYQYKYGKNTYHTSILLIMALVSHGVISKTINIDMNICKSNSYGLWFKSLQFILLLT